MDTAAASADTRPALCLTTVRASGGRGADSPRRRPILHNYGGGGGGGGRSNFNFQLTATRKKKTMGGRRVVGAILTPFPPSCQRSHSLPNLSTCPWWAVRQGRLIIFSHQNSAVRRVGEYRRYSNESYRRYCSHRYLYLYLVNLQISSILKYLQSKQKTRCCETLSNSDRPWQALGWDCTKSSTGQGPVQCIHHKGRKTAPIASKWGRYSHTTCPQWHVSNAHRGKKVWSYKSRWPRWSRRSLNTKCHMSILTYLQDNWAWILDNLTKLLFEFILPNRGCS